MSWVDDLHTKYNHLFEKYEGEEGGYYKPGQILRGIECGDAWERIVTRLLESLEWHRTHNTYVPNPNFIDRFRYEEGNPEYIDGGPNMVQVFQIKEKFGRLTAYVKCSDNIKNGVEHAIGYAEGQSDLTCYSCGNIGDYPMTNKGWIIRLCPDCMNKKESK